MAVFLVAFIDHPLASLSRVKAAWAGWQVAQGHSQPRCPGSQPLAASHLPTALGQLSPAHAKKEELNSTASGADL